jgi:hypothetical protein
MNLDEFRDQLEMYRRRVDEEANSVKDSYLALERLYSLYRSFAADERTMADKVLAEWAISDVEDVRYDALALIDDFKIRAAMPALRLLTARLESSSSPGAPYELRKVTRILADLGGQ